MTRAGIEPASLEHFYYIITREYYVLYLFYTDNYQKKIEIYICTYFLARHYMHFWLVLTTKAIN